MNSTYVSRTYVTFTSCRQFHDLGYSLRIFFSKLGERQLFNFGHRESVTLPPKCRMRVISVFLRPIPLTPNSGFYASGYKRFTTRSLISNRSLRNLQYWTRPSTSGENQTMIASGFSRNTSRGLKNYETR